MALKPESKLSPEKGGFRLNVDAKNIGMKHEK